MTPPRAPRPSLSAELLAMSARVAADIGTGPYELRMLAIAKLEPMLHDAYEYMYTGRGWYTTDQIAAACHCTINRAGQLVRDLRLMGLVKRGGAVVNGRKRQVWRAV